MWGAPRANDRRVGRQAAESHGRRSEFWAALWLTCKFYRVLVKTRLGELDLVALSPDGVLCFIEVKARALEGAAAEAITGRQRSRIERAAADLFVQLGEFPRHGGLARTQDLRHVRQRRGQALCRFEENQRRRNGAEFA